MHADGRVLCRVCYQNEVGMDGPVPGCPTCGHSETRGDRLAQIRSLWEQEYGPEEIDASVVRDVRALVEIAKAAREQAHEHPGEEWGYDASGIHVYDGPDRAGQGCPQCDALARLDSGATEGGAK